MKRLFFILVFSVNTFACGEPPMSDLFISVTPSNTGASNPVVASAPPRAGQPVGLIDFNGEQGSPELVTLACYARATTNVGVVGGPVVGILSFGSGNGSSQLVEFDIPVMLPMQPDNGIWNGAGGGVLVSFPMTHCNFGVRNDGGVIPPFAAPLVNTPIGSGATVQVTCSLATGGKNSNDHVYRNIYAVSAAAPATGLPIGASAIVFVPSFATRYRVLRNPVIGTVLNISPQTNIGAGTLDGPFLVPAGTPSPWFDLPPGVTNIVVLNDATSTSAIATLVIQFEIGL